MSPSRICRNGLESTHRENTEVAALDIEGKAVMAERETPQRMQCMEVWGGNVQIATEIETSGLDVWIRSQPEGESKAGGDVYYVSSCASGRITRLLLADVSGHGEGVADSATRLRDLMRKNVNTIGQRSFIAGVNRHFTEAPHDSRFATAIVSSFFSPTSSLTVCNAGHPPPFVFRAADGKWSGMDLTESSQNASTAKAADVPLGITSDAFYYEYKSRLNEGDLVLCYTDAFSEARDAGGKILGIDGLLSIVSSIQFTSAERFLSDIVESLQRLSAGNLEQDDATMLMFRANGVRSSLRDNLLAPFRLMGQVADRSTITPPSPAVSAD
jgi:serine phosphatase RsbU (regulator of sigma subunit)